MCTVTIVPLGTDDRVPRPTRPAGFRLACNRDEARTRLPALAPRPRLYAERMALVPLDGEKGGTWIAVSDAGLAMALLNRRTAPPSEDRNALRATVEATSEERPSRGRIIPALLASGTLVEAMHRADQFLPGGFSPFRLVLTDGRQVGELVWDGARLTARRGPWSGEPLLFTSSGLGDRLVARPRRTLFRSMVAVAGPADLEACQDLFHRHSWPDRPHLSVCMRRDDACTVSHSVIEVRPGERSRFLYYPDAPDTGVAPTIAWLPMRRAGEAAP